MSEALVLYSDQSAEVIPEAVKVIAQWTDFVKQARADGPIPINDLGQSIADEIRKVDSQAATFLRQYESAAKAAREPYYDRFKQMKARADSAIIGFAEVLGQLHSDLLVFELEKRRVEDRINRQREEEAAQNRREEERKQREAEAERQRQEKAEHDHLAVIERERKAAEEALARLEREAAQSKTRAARKEAEELARQAREHQAAAESAAAVEQEKQAAAEAQRNAERELAQQSIAEASAPAERFAAPVTDGARVNVAYEFTVTNQRKFASWCWASGRAHWVRNVEFAKREITEEINAPDGVRNIPGVEVVQALGVVVKKTRTQRPINIQAMRVAF